MKIIDGREPVKGFATNLNVYLFWALFYVYDVSRDPNRQYKSIIWNSFVNRHFKINFESDTLIAGVARCDMHAWGNFIAYVAAASCHLHILK